MVIIIWEVTVASTLAASYTDIAATGAGLVADQSNLFQASDRKSAEYADFSSSHIVQSVAVENPGPINSATLSFLGNLGHRISSVCIWWRQRNFVFFYFSASPWRSNVLILCSCMIPIAIPALSLTLGIYTTNGIKKNNNERINKIIINEHLRDAGLCLDDETETETSFTYPVRRKFRRRWTWNCRRH